MSDDQKKQLGAILWAIADKLSLFLKYLSDKYEEAVKNMLKKDYDEIENEAVKNNNDSYIEELKKIIVKHSKTVPLSKLNLNEDEKDKEKIKKARENWIDDYTKMLSSNTLQPIILWYIKNLDNIDLFEKEIRRKIHYVIKPQYLWRNIYELAKTQNEELLNTLVSGFKHIENESFERINLYSEKLGRSYTERNKLISSIITEIADGISQFSNDTDILGDAYEYLIAQFAAGSGKKAGEFYTPQPVSTILSRIVVLDCQDPSKGKKTKINNIFDFACGSGSLLINVRKQFKEDNFGQIYGQEKNITTYNLARMNMILHGVKDSEFTIFHGDSLLNEWNILSEMNPAKKKLFDVVVANPPFSYRWQPKEDMENDFRFKDYGLAPKSAADFAFLLHGFHFLSNEGTMAIILPHGVLFRGGSEEKIRTKLLQDGNIDAVIGLPSNLFAFTGIPVCILVLKKCKKFDDVLIINASNEFIKGKRQNILSDEHIDKIVDTYQYRKEDNKKYSRRVSMKEIEKNGYNLNISRYVNTSDEEEIINIDEVIGELESIELEIKNAKLKHNSFLKELGLKELP
ncbi:type I restriction-modification system subunit M [Brachyspira innocens]|uniref:type I restriction-modification system subunit M n=1 Tax=Brachyspira innocens TaxID=13264 RepID=UPI0026EE12F6|nr:type I restriction-modification system subunit M [Brachyspira innocens]